MAALNRPTEATYIINEHVTVDTTDRQDHTFCGIMFPVKCKRILPVTQIVIKSIAVRGRLGPLTVWVTKESVDENDRFPGTGHVLGGADTTTAKKTRQLASQEAVRFTRSHSAASGGSAAAASKSQTGEMSTKPKHWTKIYQKKHACSMRDYCELDLSANPIVLKPGQVRGIYVHSTMQGDEAIVYDNCHKRLTHDDSLLTIFPGRAHVSETPFGRTPIWGWGNAWRDDREFVGRIHYGAVYRLWNPREHYDFGSSFQTSVRCLFACQRRFDSPMAMLPDDCIFYILNMCRWDWFDDDCNAVRRAKNTRTKTLEEKATAASQKPPAVAAMPTKKPPVQEEASGMAKCTRSSTKRSFWTRRNKSTLTVTKSTPAAGLKVDDDDDHEEEDEDDDDADDEMNEEEEEEEEEVFMEARYEPLEVEIEDDDDDDEDYKDAAVNDDDDDLDAGEEEDDDDDDDDESEEDEDGSPFDGYTESTPFYFRDYDEFASDAEHDDDEDPTGVARLTRRSWLRRRLGSNQVLRALAYLHGDMLMTEIDDEIAAQNA